MFPGYFFLAFFNRDAREIESEWDADQGKCSKNISLYPKTYLSEYREDRLCRRQTESLASLHFTFPHSNELQIF